MNKIKFEAARKQLESLELTVPHTQPMVFRLVLYLARGNAKENFSLKVSERLEYLIALQKKWVGHEEVIFTRRMKVVNIVPRDIRRVAQDRVENAGAALLPFDAYTEFRLSGRSRHDCYWLGLFNAKQ
ncbi:MAG TPA: hypothetical protein VEA59_04575 [Patescibacteria group bacterium]|nr:hypothetical protein [Patescibacteria group bacterium]